MHINILLLKIDIINLFHTHFFMTDQQIVFTLIGFLFVTFAINKVRYDVVAICALVVASIAGVVPNSEVFSGFGHPAVIIVALVLVASRGLIYAGSVDLITHKISKYINGVASQVGIMGSVAALLSSFINNIAALAILMPADINLSKKHGRSPSSTLMPLSFASILGGMVTMIGTAPNVVIATFREDALGSAYSMFDFAFVGLVVAVSGVIFISFVGWRLMPVSSQKTSTIKDSIYTANAHITSESSIVNKHMYELTNLLDESEVCVLGVIRHGMVIEKNLPIQKDDLLILQGSVKNIDQFISKINAKYEISHENQEGYRSTVTLEVVIPAESSMIGKTAKLIALLKNRGVALLGISRSGETILSHVREVSIEAGDILLLQGERTNLDSAIGWMDGLLLDIEDRNIEIPDRRKAIQAIVIFTAAIILSSVNYIYLPIALVIVIVAYLALGILPANVAYQSISWRVIVLLGSMIPIGNALTTTGGTETISQAIFLLTKGLSPVTILIILLVITMTLSDVLNNVATVLIAAPISVGLAQQLGVNPDAFLMAVAVGASCAFLTPIGHQNNSLILGPGGYKFSDYWRLGLPLEIVVVLTGVPAILFFWPL